MPTPRYLFVNLTAADALHELLETRLSKTTMPQLVLAGRIAHGAEYDFAGKDYAELTITLGHYTVSVFSSLPERTSLVLPLSLKRINNNPGPPIVANRYIVMEGGKVLWFYRATL